MGILFISELSCQRVVDSWMPLSALISSYRLHLYRLRLYTCFHVVCLYIICIYVVYTHTVCIHYPNENKRDLMCGIGGINIPELQTLSYPVLEVASHFTSIVNTSALKPFSPSKSSQYSKTHRNQTHHVQILRLKAVESAPCR
jgi:hypothetical protein